MKALYDYDATQPTELTVKEDEILHVYGNDDEWLLVASPEEGRVGYVPGNYVEEVCISYHPFLVFIRRVWGTGERGRGGGRCRPRGDIIIVDRRARLGKCIYLYRNQRGPAQA